MAGLDVHECGGDDGLWTDGDLRTTLPIVELVVEEYVAGLVGDRLTEPDAGGTTIAEHVDAIARAAGAVTPDVSSAAYPTGLAPDVRRRALDAVHEVTRRLHAIGRARAALGAGTSPAQGQVVALHRSGGGVPKQPVDRVDVTCAGVVGDVQADRKHHGRPFQALCLWSEEVMQALRDEGHPIRAGLAGENVTVAGVEWASLRPGTVLTVGQVRAEISSYATPCAKNAAWFVDRDFKRIDQDVHPGWGRLYAWVLRPGRIAVGDAVSVEPQSS